VFFIHKFFYTATRRGSSQVSQRLKFEIDPERMAVFHLAEESNKVPGRFPQAAFRSISAKP